MNPRGARRRVAVGQISQESNSFVSVLTDIDLFRNSYLYDGAELLDVVRGKSTREAERALAERHPEPPVASSVRACPNRPRTTQGKSAEPSLEFGDRENARTDETPVSPAALAQHRAPEKLARAIEPIGARRYILKITIGEAAHKTLHQLRALMRHRVPGGEALASEGGPRHRLPRIDVGAELLDMWS